MLSKYFSGKHTVTQPNKFSCFKIKYILKHVDKIIEQWSTNFNILLRECL